MIKFKIGENYTINLSFNASKQQYNTLTAKVIARSDNFITLEVNGDKLNRDILTTSDKHSEYTLFTESYPLYAYDRKEV